MFRLSERPERNNIIRALVTCVLGQPTFQTMKPPKQVLKEEQYIPPLISLNEPIESGKSQSPY